MIEDIGWRRLQSQTSNAWVEGGGAQDGGLEEACMMNRASEEAMV